MNSFLNYLFQILSKLSLKKIYSLSGTLYYILYYVIRYRKKVVRCNLKIAFPNKTFKERKNIEKKFYKNFSDFMLEMLKASSMKKEEFKKHMQLENLELIQQCKEKGKDVILLTGHMFNWEWLTGICQDLPQEKRYAIYKKVANNFFDAEVHEARARFGAIPLSVKEVGREMLRLPNNGEHIFLFVADQSPFKTRIHYELNFFNRITPAFNGYDKIARKKDYAIVYVEMIKKSRGQYTAKFKQICPDGEKFKENEIVNKFYKELTHNILTCPDIWLWSHKRWKYTSGIDYKI